MKHTEEAKHKMSLSRIGNKYSLGRKQSEETKRKISETKKGRKQTEEHKQSIRNALMGRKLTKEWKNKIGQSNLGSNNGQWRGDDVKLYSLHRWVERRKTKPEYCEICNKTPPIDLANISGKYLRDITDFQWLCRKCHMMSDNRIANLIHGKKPCIDMSDRKCNFCGKGTYIQRTRNARPHWRYINGQLACNKCYNDEWKRRKIV